MVRKGYKQTEIGEIPEDWEAIALGDITTLMTNGFVGEAKSHYTNDGDGVLYIQGFNVKENSFDFSGIKYVTEEFHKAHMKSCLKAGDLLTVQTGDVGLTTVISDSLIGSNCHALIISRVNNKKCYSKYISFYLNSNRGRARLKLIEIGSTMKHLNISDMLCFLIPLPQTLSEQRLIATALSDVDDLITSLDKLITKKRAIKTATMQQLLTPPEPGQAGKKRLPGFEGEWEIKKLNQIGCFTKGSGIRKDEVKETGLPCIRYGEIYTCHNNYIRRYYSYISLSTAKQSWRLKKGDLLFAGSGETAEEIGKCVAFLSEEEAYAGGDIVIFSPNGQDSKFLGYLMNHYEIVEQKIKLGQGDAVVHISAKNLGNIKLSLPEIDEQRAIASILSDMDAEIEALDKRRDKTKMIKQGMMQELLTGKTRLIDTQNTGTSN